MAPAPPVDTEEGSLSGASHASPRAPAVGRRSASGEPESKLVLAGNELASLDHLAGNGGAVAGGESLCFRPIRSGWRFPRPKSPAAAARDPVYNDRLGAVAEISTSRAANDGDIATARALFEHLENLVPEPGRSQIGIAP